MTAFSRVDFKPARFASMSAADRERIDRVAAVAIPELRRMAGLTLDADGRIDLMKLNAALAGQPVDRRMRLKSMLAEIGAIPA